MKSKLIVTVLPIFFIVVACTPAATVIPETKVVISTATASQTPTQSKANTPEATATETITAEEIDFLEQGYDKKGSLEDGVIYGIVQESTVNYMKDGGIKVEAGGIAGYALSTTEIIIYNPEIKQFETAKVVTDWSIATGYDDGSYYTYPIDVGTFGSDPLVIPQHLVKSAREQYIKITPGNQPFVKIMLDYEVPFNDRLNEFLSAVFPNEEKITYVTISGIGKVLAVKGILPQGFPGWEE